MNTSPPNKAPVLNFTNYLDKHLKDKEKIGVVDNKGRVISQASRSQVYKAGYLHSAVNIILVNNEGLIFIQKRSRNKTFPLYWDISLVELYGTVYEGEIKINQEEIMEGKFISLIKLEELIINKNIKFTPWGLEEINYLFRHQCIISELIHGI